MSDILEQRAHLEGRLRAAYDLGGNIRAEIDALMANSALIRAAVALAEDIGLDRHRECPSCGFLNGTAHGAPCTCVKWAAAKAALAAQKGGKS